MLSREHLASLTLLGICSGGKVAIGTAIAEPSVAQLVLWSAEALSPLRAAATETRKTLHALGQYAAKALRAETWRKLVSGGADLRLVRKAVMEHETPDRTELDREADILAAFHDYTGSVLFIYGTNDPETKDAARRYEDFCRAARIPHTFHEIEGANHSFYSLNWEKQVITHTRQWLLQARE
jgi:acetyl esterase/lipase